MKKYSSYFLIFILGCISFERSHAQTSPWRTISSVSSDNANPQYAGFWMTSANTGYGVSQRYISPSSGEDWYVYGSINNWEDSTLLDHYYGNSACCNISQLFFLNDSVGFKVQNQFGGYHCTKTSDRGHSWSMVGTTMMTSKNFFFINDTLGYSVGISYADSSAELRRFDGNSFSSDLISSTDYDFSNAKVYFISDSTGFILCKDTNGTNLLLRTTDYASNWITVFSDSVNEFKSINFPSNNTGYMTCSNGVIYKSTSAGVNWNVILPPTNWSLNDVSFLNDSVGLVVSDFGGIYRTTDGGNSWLSENSGTSFDLIYVKLFPNNIAYAASTNIYYDFAAHIRTTLLTNTPPPVTSTSTQFLIYPNPFNGLFTMEVSDDMLNSDVYIYDNLGSLVYVSKVTQGISQIAIPSLAVGIYHVKLVTPDGTSFHKTILEN